MSLRLRKRISQKPAWLGSWIKLLPPKVPNEKAAVAFITKIVIDAAAVAVTWTLRALGLPVIVKWLIWLACFVAFVEILQPAIAPLTRLPGKTRWLIKGILVACFCYFSYGTARHQWREEKAAALSGHIRSASIDTQTRPMLEFGDSGTKLAFLGPSGTGLIKIMYDAGLRIEHGKGGLELSTIIRNRAGNVVVDISRNHWLIANSQSIVWDKNYNRDSLEVLDGREHVVFQARILSDRIQLQGEWHDDVGHGFGIASAGHGLGGYFHILGPKMPIIEEIKPIFKYPSSDHWGELVNPSGPD